MCADNFDGMMDASAKVLLFNEKMLSKTNNICFEPLRGGTRHYKCIKELKANNVFLYVESELSKLDSYFHAALCLLLSKILQG